MSFDGKFHIYTFVYLYSGDLENILSRFFSLLKTPHNIFFLTKQLQEWELMRREIFYRIGDDGNAYNSAIRLCKIKPKIIFEIRKKNVI